MIGHEEVVAEYVTWCLYSMAAIFLAVAATHYISPHAIGSGIPEMKTILTGVELHHYLAPLTFISKVCKEGVGVGGEAG